MKFIKLLLLLFSLSIYGDYIKAMKGPKQKKIASPNIQNLKNVNARKVLANKLQSKLEAKNGIDSEANNKRTVQTSPVIEKQNKPQRLSDYNLKQLNVETKDPKQKNLVYLKKLSNLANIFALENEVIKRLKELKNLAKIVLDSTHSKIFVSSLIITREDAESIVYPLIVSRYQEAYRNIMHKQKGYSLRQCLKDCQQHIDHPQECVSLVAKSICNSIATYKLKCKLPKLVKLLTGLFNEQNPFESDLIKFEGSLESTVKNYNKEINCIVALLTNSFKELCIKLIELNRFFYEDLQASDGAAKDLYSSIIDILDCHKKCENELNTLYCKMLCELDEVSELVPDALKNLCKRLRRQCSYSIFFKKEMESLPEFLYELKKVNKTTPEYSFLPDYIIQGKNKKVSAEKAKQLIKQKTKKNKAEKQAVLRAKAQEESDKLFKELGDYSSLVKKHEVEEAVNKDILISNARKFFYNIEEKEDQPLNPAAHPLLRYNQRVKNWFNSAFVVNENKCRKDILYHTYNPLIDHFVHKYGVREQRSEKRGEPNLQITSPGLIIDNETVQFVRFSLTFNNSQRECYHREMVNLSSLSQWEALFKKNMPDKVKLDDIIAKVPGQLYGINGTQDYEIPQDFDEWISNIITNTCGMKTNEYVTMNDTKNNLQMVVFTNIK